MFVLYQLIVGLVFWLCFPFLLIFVWITGKHRRGLCERLGFYKFDSRSRSQGPRIWIHAASIGEVRAAGILIGYLEDALPEFDILVTTMTIHGRDFARKYLGTDCCFLAPLDVPFIVDRVIATVTPNVYVCLETELWPLLIRKLHGNNTSTLLLNGRLSDKSIGNYVRFRLLFGPVLQSFSAIGAITVADRQRFIDIGAASASIEVTGNIKHDSVIPLDQEEIINKWRQTLGIHKDTDVFIAGSTHSPEEELLLPLFDKLSGQYNQLCLIAPRHLDRLDGLAVMLAQNNVAYDRLSRLIQGERRNHTLILVDTIGDLAELYSIATFVFVGGSLTPYGGHNVMEAAIWEKIIFFGPHIDDFREAAEWLVKSGGGFMIGSVSEMEDQLCAFLNDRDKLIEAQKCAGKAARKRQGAGEQQVQLILQVLGSKPLNGER